MPEKMTTSRDLLELLAEFMDARGSGDAAVDGDALQLIAQRFDVALTDYVIERSVVQNEA